MLFHSLKQTLFRARHTQGKEGDEDDSPCDDHHSVDRSIVQMIYWTVVHTKAYHNYVCWLAS